MQTIEIGDKFVMDFDEIKETWILESFGTFPDGKEFINFKIDGSSDTISHYHKDEFLELLLKEKLAEIEHQRWADWQKHLHSLCVKNPDNSLTIPKDKVEQWEKQIATEYKDLTTEEKNSDRDQVNRYWDIIKT